MLFCCVFFFFFFNDTATTEIYTLSLHDALPIWSASTSPAANFASPNGRSAGCPDRKSTRLNSSHLGISYAVFCLKKQTRVETRSYTGPRRFRRHPHLRDDAVDFFFFNDTATTEIYTLSLHDALPISQFASCNASMMLNLLSSVTWILISG